MRAGVWPRAPRTPFADIHQLEPGTYAVWERGTLRTHRYYALGYPEQRHEPGDALRQLDETMRSSVALRLRSDVPVGGYLSGGLDSKDRSMGSNAQHAMRAIVSNSAVAATRVPDNCRCPCDIWVLATCD